MVSSTRQTKRRRAIRHKAMARNNSFKRRTATPTFPIHPEGYDPTAADAKKPAASTES